MKYSCVIGTYNPKPEWLERAIRSAIGLFDEIILVNDGSKEFPLWLVSQFKKDVVFLSHDANMGFYQAKNTAIQEATGDIIAILDDDDYFDGYGVKKLKDFIEVYESDIYHFKLKEFGLSNGVYDGGGQLSELEYRNSIPGISWFKRKVWEELGGYKNVKAEDWAFWREAYKKGKTFSYFPEIVYNMNVRSDSVSRRWNVPFEEIRNEVLNAYK